MCKECYKPVHNRYDNKTNKSHHKIVAGSCKVLLCGNSVYAHKTEHKGRRKESKANRLCLVDKEHRRQCKTVYCRVEQEKEGCQRKRKGLDCCGKSYYKGKFCNDKSVKDKF